MKSIILMCAAVIITSGAFAGNNSTTKLRTTQSASQNSILISNLSLSGNVSYHSSKAAHRVYRRHLKLTLKNPFRRIELDRTTRY